MKVRKLKILEVAPQLPIPPIDGGKISIYGQLKSLASRGHEIDFVCYKNYKTSNEEIIELLKYSYPTLINLNTKNNLVKAFINLFSSKPYNVSKYISKKLLKAIEINLIDKDFDIIIIDHIHMAWVVDFIRQLTHSPIVLREHNFESDIIYRYFKTCNNFILKGYLFNQYKRIINYETSLAQKFDKVIMISKADEEKIKSFNPHIDTITIPCGVDEDLLKHKAYNNYKLKYSLFHIGDLGWYPNLDGLKWFIHKVFPLVLKKIPDVKLFIYGKNCNRLKISNNLKKNIVIKGFVENLIDEIKDKEIGIIPLRIGSGIRIKILELMAQGHCLVSTSIGCEGIDVNDGKNIIVADSENYFAEKIFYLFTNDDAIRSIGLNASNFIKENFLWKDIVKKFESLFFNLIEDKSKTFKD
jgi:glycosyltransferase involved in cell wall biosynthesis